MQANRIKHLLLPLILIAYASMYIATTKKESFRCNEICMKFSQIDTMVLFRRPFITSASQCHDTAFCVLVYDTIPRNWNLLADTACMYMNSLSLFNYRVIIRSNVNGDTLVNKRCP